MTSISSERAGAPDPFVPPGAAPPVDPPDARWRRTIPWVKQLPFIVLLAGISVLFVYPFLWLVSSSLKTRANVFDNKLIPHPFAHDVFHNYAVIWSAAPFLRWFANSMYITILAAVLVTFASALTAFTFAYFRFPLRNFLFGCVLATMMLPTVVTMIPVYLIWHHVGTLDVADPAVGAEPVRQRVLHLPAAAVLHGHTARRTSKRRAWTATTTSRCSGASPCRWRGRR